MLYALDMITKINNNIIVLRFWVIILVVLGHSIILYDPSWGIYVPKEHCEIFRVLKVFINQIQMPLFFSISGYLFYFSTLKYNFIQILTKKIKRIIIPYLIICFLWMDPIKMSLGVSGYNNFFHLLPLQLMDKMNGHLWFLYTLFELFVVFKFLHSIGWIGGRRKYREFFIFLLLICLNLNSAHFGPLTNTAQYALYFYFTFLLNEYEINRLPKKHIIYLCIGMIFMLVLSLYDIVLYKYIRCIIICSCLIILYRIDLQYLRNPFVNCISNNSFGIYLLHSPLVYITYTFWRDINPIFVLILNFVLFGSVALLLSLVLKSTRLKFIIGE